MITNKKDFIKKTLNESKLRSIKVFFENGDSITTNMAGHLTDQEMLDYYKVGKSFNIGKGGHDLISKVKSAQILESFTNDLDVEDAQEYTSNNHPSIDMIENDLYDIIEQLPGTQNSKQLAMGVDKDFDTLYFHKSGLNRAQISQLETQFKELISKYAWADMVSVDVTRLNGDDVSFNVNYEENIKESFNDDLQEQVESDLYDIIDELPGIQNDAQASMGVDSDTEGNGTTVLFFYKDVDKDVEIGSLDDEFKQLVSKYSWADSVYTSANEVDSNILTPGMKEISFSVNLNDNDVREAYDEKGIDKSELKMLKNIYKLGPTEYIKKKIEELEAKLNESSDDKLGINLRSLLDGEIAINIKSKDLSNYNDRNDLIDEIEKRIQECDWVSLSNGTTYTKSFKPTRESNNFSDNNELLNGEPIRENETKVFSSQQVTNNKFSLDKLKEKFPTWYFNIHNSPPEKSDRWKYTIFYGSDNTNNREIEFVKSFIKPLIK